jgi:hypothetical protein
MSKLQKRQRFDRGSGSDPFGDLTLLLIQPFELGNASFYFRKSGK